MEAARSIIAQWQAEPAAFEDDDASVMKMLEFATRQYRVYQQGPAETRLSVVISGCAPGAARHARRACSPQRR